MSKDEEKLPSDVESRVRELAYLMWERAGRIPDMAHEYWVAAEREVLAAVHAAREKLLPDEKPEEAEAPKVEAAEPASPSALEPVAAPAKPEARTPRARTRKTEAGEPKPKKASKLPAARAESKAPSAEPQASKTAASEQHASEATNPARAAKSRTKQAVEEKPKGDPAEAAEAPTTKTERATRPARKWADRRKGGGVGTRPGSRWTRKK